jgi:hypothetical protein
MSSLLKMEVFRFGSVLGIKHQHLGVFNFDSYIRDNNPCCIRALTYSSLSFINNTVCPTKYRWGHVMSYTDFLRFKTFV